MFQPMKEVERKKKYENYNKKKRDKDLNRQQFFCTKSIICTWILKLNRSSEWFKQLDVIQI